MGWEIDKTFDFCYGHRVHTQVLNGEYADDLKCACRHLHGHQGNVQVYLIGEALDTTGMITDFRHTEWLKRVINNVIDHRFIIDRNDPMYNRIVGNDKLLDSVTVQRGMNKEEFIIGEKVSNDSLDIITDSHEREYMESFFIVNFVPTSENLSKWVADFVDFMMMPLNVAVSKVDWWETPKSRSSYTKNSAVFKNGIRII